MYLICTDDPDITFLTLPEGCPYSAFNDPPFPSRVERIQITFPKFDFNNAATFPFPQFANFFPGTNFEACVILTVIDDDNFEGEEFFNVTIEDVGPQYIPIDTYRLSTIVSLRDPEGKLSPLHF